jgi:hypothetical protein
MSFRRCETGLLITHGDDFIVGRLDASAYAGPSGRDTLYQFTFPAPKDDPGLVRLYFMPISTNSNRPPPNTSRGGPLNVALSTQNARVLPARHSNEAISTHQRRVSQAMHSNVAESTHQRSELPAMHSNEPNLTDELATELTLDAPGSWRQRPTNTANRVGSEISKIPIFHPQYSLPRTNHHV